MGRAMSRGMGRGGVLVFDPDFDFDTAFARFSSYLGFVHNRFRF